MVLLENQQDGKPFSKLTKGHRNGVLINKMRNEKGEIIADVEEI